MPLAKAKDTAFKLGVTLLATVVAFVPAWIFLGIRSLAAPEGFWQNLALGVAGFWVLGGFQLFFLIALVIFLVEVWGN